MRSRDGGAWDFLAAEARLFIGIFSLANHKPCDIEKDGIYNSKIYIQAAVNCAVVLNE